MKEENIPILNTKESILKTKEFLEDGAGHTSLKVKVKENGIYVVRVSLDQVLDTGREARVLGKGEGSSFEEASQNFF